MFNMTKADLIKKYENGELRSLGYHILSNTHSVTIVYIDHESNRVFGFLGGDNGRDFFFVKHDGAGNFKVGSLRLNTGQFMRY